LRHNRFFNQGASMLYTLEMNNWNVEIKIEADDFDLIFELQSAIDETLANYEFKDSFNVEEDDEEEEVSYTLVAKKK